MGKLKNILFGTLAMISSCSTVLAVEDAVIVVGSKEDWCNQHAGNELAKYLTQITGSTIPVMKDSVPELSLKKNMIVIGNSSANKLAKELEGKGFIDLSILSQGDGFIEKNIIVEEKNYLILAGREDLSTLYAVYDYLERFYHVGFFEDGERVPNGKKLVIDKVDVREEPRFDTRINLGCCALAYTMAYWDFEEWEKELDWMAKKKFNAFWLTYGHTPPTIGGEVVWKNVYRRFSINIGEPTEWEMYQSKLCKDIVSYANRLGMRVIAPTFSGLVNEEFKKFYPKGKYFEVRRPGCPVEIWLHPEDPMFVKLGVAIIEEYRKLYGPCSFDYTQPQPNPEWVAEGSKEELKAIKQKFAEASLEILKKADPKGRYNFSGWSFQGMSDFWNPEDTKEFFSIFPKGTVLIWDFVDNFGGVHPTYKKYDYFWNHDWACTILHCMAGEGYLHGDINYLVRQIKEIDEDPNASFSKGFFLSPEIIRQNFFYYDLCANLAWSPKDFSLERFLNDYALRRYGEKSSDKMMNCFKKLLESVYSPSYNDELRNFSYFFHQYAMGIEHIPQWYTSAINRLRLATPMKDAIEIALLEKERQKGNKLYEKDLVDMCGQYLGELCNGYVLSLYKDFSINDKKSFENTAKKIDSCLYYLENILSTRTDRVDSIQTEIEKAETLPGSKKIVFGHPHSYEPQDVERAIKEAVTVLYHNRLDLYPNGLDYAHRNIYELLKFYYRPRIEIFVGALRENLSGKGVMNDIRFSNTNSKIFQEYKKIAEKFVCQPLPRRKELPPETISVVDEVFKDIKSNLANIDIEALADFNYPSKLNDNFDDGDANGWKIDSGTWSVENGEFIGDAKGYGFTFTPIKFREGAVRFRFKFIRGYEGATSLQIRLEGENNTYVYLTIYARDSKYNPNGYLIYHVDQGKISHMQQSLFDLGYNKWYNVELKIAEQKINFYIDKSLITEYTRPDSPAYTEFRLGADSAQVHFDDVQIEEKDE